MPHLHLSLQSGDDLVLKRMKRRHARGDAVRLVETLRRRRPDIAIGADLIAGFPTESEAAHANNLSIDPRARHRPRPCLSLFAPPRHPGRADAASRSPGDQAPRRRAARSGGGRARDVADRPDRHAARRAGRARRHRPCAQFRPGARARRHRGRAARHHRPPRHWPAECCSERRQLDPAAVRRLAQDLRTPDGQSVGHRLDDQARRGPARRYRGRADPLRPRPARRRAHSRAYRRTALRTRRRRAGGRARPSPRRSRRSSGPSPSRSRSSPFRARR